MADDAKRAFYLGRYNCIERLGEGPLGETFRAKIYGVAGFEKQFAVKRLHAALCVDEPFVARFVTAATSYAGLDHERIARVHEVDVQGSQYYLVVDLVRGLDLAGLIKTLRARGEAMSSDGALLLALDLAEALEHAHARKDLLPGGVLHLGLSPQTVMLTFEGEIKLLDVGLVASLLRPGWADSDALVPTLAYLAPEELRGGPVDGRADVFSLGAILYELLSGERAFEGEHAAEVRQKIEAAPPPPPPADGRVQALLAHALAADPAARFPSVTALRDALVPILGSRVSKARGELASLVRRLGRPASRTGSFAAVVIPPSPMPVSPTPPAAPSAPWSPPIQKPAPRVPPPVPPQLSSPPPINTLAGTGAGDALPIARLNLPGPTTTPSMPAIVVGHDDTTTPMEKVDLEPLLAMTGELDAPPAGAEELAETEVLPESIEAAPNSESAAPTAPPQNFVPPPPPPFFATQPEAATAEAPSASVFATQQNSPEAPATPPSAAPPPPPPPAVPPPIPAASLPSFFTAPATVAPPPLPPPPDSVPTIAPEGSTPLFAPPPPSVESPEPSLLTRMAGGPVMSPGRPVLPLMQPLHPAAGARGPMRWIAIGVGAAAAAFAIFFFVGRHKPTGDAIPPKPTETQPAENPTTAKPATETATKPPEVATAEKPATETATKPTEAQTANKPSTETATKPTETPTANKPSTETATKPTEKPTTATNPTTATPTTANPTAANPAATGEGVEIATTPPGASVFVDGALRGQTPLRVEVAAGAHRLIVVAEGFRLVKLPLRAGSPRLDLKLEAATLPAQIAGPAGLKVRCKTSLRIFVDSVDTGRACPNDERISVTPGPHMIGLYSPITDETHELEHDVADGEHSTRVYTKF